MLILVEEELVFYIFFVLGSLHTIQQGGHLEDQALDRVWRRGSAIINDDSSCCVCLLPPSFLCKGWSWLWWCRKGMVLPALESKLKLAHLTHCERASHQWLPGDVQPLLWTVRVQRNRQLHLADQSQLGSVQWGVKPLFFHFIWRATLFSPQDHLLYFKFIGRVAGKHFAELAYL